MITTSVRAYHFVGATLRDGSPIPPDGVWLEHTGPITICQAGYHASRHPFDALQYAPGATLCLVEIDGDIVESEDKLVGRRRRIVARIDATDLLRRFACDCALTVADLWDMPEIVRMYLTTQDPTLRGEAEAAAGAAWAAAWAAGAARAAAWAAEAARAAAEAAAGAAAEAAAGAAWAAAWAAAVAAAAAAARASQRAAFKAAVDAACGGHPMTLALLLLGQGRQHSRDADPVKYVGDPLACL